MNELESLWVFTVVTQKGPQKVGAPPELDRVLIEVLHINIPAHLCQAKCRCSQMHKKSSDFVLNTHFNLVI